MRSCGMRAISLFPLNTILFPDGRLPLQVFEVRYLDLIKRCIAGGESFGVVPLLEGSELRVPERRETLARVGTMARIEAWTAPAPGLLKIECVGTQRFQVRHAEQLKHGLWVAEVDLLPDDMAVAVPPELADVASALAAVIRSLEKKQLPAGQMLLGRPHRLDDAGWVANRWCELLRLDPADKLRLLQQDNPLLRLELIQDVLSENGLLS